MSKLIQQIAVGAGILCTGMSALAANTPEKGKSDNQPKQPNILVIFGDDIGIMNISAYNNGMLGYRTRNIDRIAKNGMMFTDYYGEQSSCCIHYRSVPVPYRTYQSRSSGS